MNMISNRDCELDYSSLQRFDKSIQDLVYKISAKKPRDRLTAKESLEHRLFRDFGLIQLGRDPRLPHDSLRKKKEELESIYQEHKEEKKFKKLEIPSLNLDQLKQYNTTKANITNETTLAKQEVLSDRGDIKPIYANDNFPNHIYSNHQRSIREMNSNDKNQNKKFGWSMTGRGIFNDQGLYQSNQKPSMKRQYQSTDRKNLNRDNDLNLQLYVHKKNISYMEGAEQNGNLFQNERHGWSNDQNLRRFGSIGVNDRRDLEKSLTPGQHTRGLSILNKDKNNFVRDVSERVKREPILQYNDIKLYQQQPINQEYNIGSDDSQNIMKIKSVDKINSNNSQDLKNNSNIIKKGLNEEPSTPKTGALKHLKRRTTKKKNNETSSKKNLNDKNKKKSHQSSFSSKLERPYEIKKSKPTSIEELDVKKKNKKGNESQNKLKKNKKNESVKKDTSKDQISSSILYSENGNKSKKKRKKTSKTNSKLIKDKNLKKNKNLKGNKKNKHSQHYLSDMKDKKRYMSVNASGKNPLLLSEFGDEFNPRKTVNLNSSHGISKNGHNLQNNDKNNLVSYKSGNNKKANLYGSTTERPSLYHRPHSQASSGSEENKQGKYKNLYSGRHEKNIIQYPPEHLKLKKSENFEIDSSDEEDALHNIDNLMKIDSNKSDYNDTNKASKNINFSQTGQKDNAPSSAKIFNNYNKPTNGKEIPKINASIFKEGSFSKLGRLTSNEIPFSARSPISPNHFNVGNHLRDLKKSGYNNKKDPIEIMKEKSKKEQLRIQEIEEWKKNNKHLKNKLSSGKISKNLFKNSDPKSLTSSYSGQEGLLNFYQKNKFKDKHSDHLNNDQMNLKNFNSNPQMYNYGMNHQGNLNLSKNKFSMKQKSSFLNNKQDFQSNKSKEHIMPEIFKKSKHNQKLI